LAIPSLLAFLGLLLVGCEGTSVSHIGIVRFDDGSPVQSGSIEFRSLADGSRYASRIARDGGFALTDQDGKFGCPLGDYEVVIVQIVLTEDLAAEDHQHGHTVPRRYADYYTTDLRVTNAADRGKSPLEITVEVDEE
jgi:hypothetical protein